MKKAQEEQKKIFLLGVGCQKGGTSWLHDYLSKNPKINMGFMKEYHVFDALYIKECHGFVESKIKELKKLLETKPSHTNPSLIKQVLFYSDINSYYEYFDYLHYSEGEVSVVGDITPAYAGLSQEALSTIKKNLEQKGFQTKLIFLMRDPFERIWSQYRMLKKYAKEHGYKNKIPDDSTQLSKYHTFSDVEFRTKYEKTIKNIEAVFNTTDIHYEFYESLFHESSIRKITDFLDVPFIEPDLGKVVNSSPKSDSDIDKTTVKNIVNFYSETYRFCMRKFGESKIKESWPSSEYLTN